MVHVELIGHSGRGAGICEPEAASVATKMSVVQAQLDLTTFTISLTPIKGFHHSDYRIYTVRHLVTDPAPAGAGRPD